MTPTQLNDYYRLTDVVKHLQVQGFQNVSPEAIRRWEMIEELIRPERRVMKTRARVYGADQLRKLEAIALLKSVNVSTITIKIFLNAKTKSLKDALRNRLVKECRQVMKLAIKAEEILANA